MNFFLILCFFIATKINSGHSLINSLSDMNMQMAGEFMFGKSRGTIRSVLLLNFSVELCLKELFLDAPRRQNAEDDGIINIYDIIIIYS